MEKRPEREDRHPRTYRLRDEDDARIKALKKLWGCSEVGVIRRLLLDATRRECSVFAHTVPTNSSPLGTRSEQIEDADSAD
jgi:hypothetical protein